MHHPWRAQDQIPQGARRQPSPRRPARAKPPAAKGRRDEVLAKAFADAMDAVGAPWPGAVALSGGGDSLALMHLLADWAKARGLPPPVALIVDHALRDGSATEAKRAAAFARKAGLSALYPHPQGRRAEIRHRGGGARRALWLDGALAQEAWHRHALCRPYPGRSGGDISSAPGTRQRAGWALGHAGAGAVSGGGLRGIESGAATVCGSRAPGCALISKASARTGWKIP